MIKFIKTKDENNNFDISDVEFRFDSSCSLTEMLEEFGYFLKAIGYQFDGDVEIVDNSEPDYSEASLSEIEREEAEEDCNCVGCDRHNCSEDECTGEETPSDDSFHTRLYDENFTGE